MNRNDSPSARSLRLFSLAMLWIAALGGACIPAHAASAAASAAETSAADGEPSSTEALPDRNQRTPRNAAYSFIMAAREGARVEAAAMLEKPADGWPEGADPVRLARALKRILDEKLWLDFAAIPDDPAPQGPVSEAEADAMEAVLGEIQLGERLVPIALEPERPGGQHWEFDAETVAAIPALARQTGNWWVSDLPAFLVDVRFAEIELWQWIGLVAIAIVGALVGIVASSVIRRGAALGEGRGFGALARSLTAFAAPAGLLLSLVAMQFAESYLGLNEPARANLSLGSRAATVLIVTWAAVRWMRAMTELLEAKFVARGIEDAVGIVRIGRVVLSALVWLLGVSATLQVFGLDLSAVIAGLGIGTAALALASQQTLANLFGGASVLADRVLRPGDAVSIGGTVATVERIGIRSTTLRTLDRTQLVVANGDLAQSRVERISARDGFRLSATLGLRYETSPAQLRAVVARLRGILAGEPLVDPASVRVHFLAFGASSLDVDVKATIRTGDAATYRDAVERLNLAFMDAIAAEGTGFAFPSQTLYLARDTAPRG